ncbi:MAG: hypothetical protein MJK10_18455 [Pseudomonadales bacterium]|nr:hypothetical protein [Pseudomonadales bacterium]NRA18115.1 copper homeostasis protein CutC [Oceanospirillaceae bacterium]
MKPTPTLEVCIDNLQALETCIALGVDRIELCSSLELGGLTPSYGLMLAAASCPVPVYVMIRPTSGEFCYDQTQLTVMLKDIEIARELGLSGVVFGAATADSRLDIGLLAELCLASEGMGKTLHRVIDLLVDPLQAIDQAVDLGFERILTSGGALSAMQGLAKLRKMQRHAQGRIEIMAGAGVSADNLIELLQSTQISALHSSCSSAMTVSESALAFGFASGNARQTDPNKIQAILDKISFKS